MDMRKILSSVLALLCIIGISLYSSKGKKIPIGFVEKLETAEEERQSRERLVETLEGALINHLANVFPDQDFSDEEIRTALTRSVQLMPRMPSLTPEDQAQFEENIKKEWENEFPGQTLTIQEIQNRATILRQIALAAQIIIDERNGATLERSTRTDLEMNFPGHVFTDQEIRLALTTAQLHIATQTLRPEGQRMSTRAWLEREYPGQKFSDQEVREAIFDSYYPISLAINIIAVTRGLAPIMPSAEQEHKTEREGKEYAQRAQSEQPEQ